MNTQTAGVTVKDLKSFAGKLWEEQDIDDPGQVIYNLLSMIDKLPDEPQPTLTIQQALEVWDACDKHIEEVQQYPYGTRSGKYKNPDKRTYFRDKFGIDIDKM